ncbi:MAG: hypothetical protein R3F65_32245 [bacterium]
MVEEGERPQAARADEGEELGAVELPRALPASFEVAPAVAQEPPVELPDTCGDPAGVVGPDEAGRVADAQRVASRARRCGPPQVVTSLASPVSLGGSAWGRAPAPRGARRVRKGRGA